MAEKEVSEALLHLRAAIVECTQAGADSVQVYESVAPLLHGSREPYPTSLAYGAAEYGGPRDVYVNGQRVQAVQKITVESEVEQFSKVTIVLSGVLVAVSPMEPVS